jgi:DNA-binding transcriptional ArsR family regulator
VISSDAGSKRTAGGEKRQQVFFALADPTRRSIIELLAVHGQMSATSIYGNFSVSHPAISQHLGVLREADLVTVAKEAQRHLYSLNQKGMNELGAWVDRTTKLWEERFEKLDEVLKREKRKSARRGK